MAATNLDKEAVEEGYKAAIEAAFATYVTNIIIKDELPISPEDRFRNAINAAREALSIARQMMGLLGG